MSGKGSASGRLWSNVLVDESLDAITGDIFKTNLDVRKNIGLEERGNEQYLSKLVSRKEKKFVAPRITKVKYAILRGRWRGGRGHGRGVLVRGRGRGGRGVGRGCGAGRGMGHGRGQVKEVEEIGEVEKVEETPSDNQEDDSMDIDEDVPAPPIQPQLPVPVTPTQPQLPVPVSSTQLELPAPAPPIRLSFPPKRIWPKLPVLDRPTQPQRPPVAPKGRQIIDYGDLDYTF